MKKCDISIYIILVIIIAVIFSLSGFNVDKKEIMLIGGDPYDEYEDYNYKQLNISLWKNTRI